MSKGRAARRKGIQFEREVAQVLRTLYPDARRQLEFHPTDARGVDLQDTGEYRFQCKKLKQYAPITAIQEVQCAPELGEVPVLVTAADGEPWMAVLPFADLVRLIERAKGRKNR